MVVLVTCKNDEDPVKYGGNTVLTRIYFYFSDTQGQPLRKHPHMFYTPSFTLFNSRKGEMRGTQNEGLFSGLD